ncbi:hypothetical protein KF840_13720 [bacterium]|nr:hypothetical protein [bacterium]
MMKPLMIEKFYAYLDTPIRMPVRVILAALIVPLLLSFVTPMWRISMYAPQYPKGLWLDIYSHKLAAGNDGQHLQEINTLNHYIGMKHLDRAEMSDLDWLPFGFGILALLALRAAAIGTTRSLIDLTMINLYVCAFAFARFTYRLYLYGHDLAPDAPVKVEPFTPAIFGTKQIANFTTHSYPAIGGYLIFLYAAGVTLLTLWYLYSGRSRALRTAAV